MRNKINRGRPRKNPPKRTAFGQWLDSATMSPMEVKDVLKCGLSTVYALANGEFSPGRDLGWRIVELTAGAVPFSAESWPNRTGD